MSTQSGGSPRSDGGDATRARLPSGRASPFDLDIHQIPERSDEPAHFHLDVRYLLSDDGEPCAGAAWYPFGEAGDGSVARLAAKAALYRMPLYGEDARRGDHPD